MRGNGLNLYKNHNKLYDLKKTSKLLGFANSEAVKYGLKGNNMKLFKDIMEDSVLNECLVSEDPSEKTDFRLSEAIDYITDTYGDEQRCYIKYDDKGLKYIYINGGMHLDSIKLSEFIERMKVQYNKYGKRSEKSMISDGNDYKALSNAYRCYFEYIQLMENGYIQFPFKGKDLENLVNIKNGNISTYLIEHIINEKMKRVEKLNGNTIQSNSDKNVKTKLILEWYNPLKIF